jgi:hypothetical protein
LDFNVEVTAMDKSKSGPAKEFSNSTQGNPGNRDRGIEGPDGVQDQDSREQGADEAREQKRHPQNDHPHNKDQQGGRDQGGSDNGNRGEGADGARDQRRDPQNGQQQGNRETDERGR